MPVSTSRFERFEYKYWVPDAVAVEAVRLAAPYLRRDSNAGEDDPVQVNTSLYLEGPDFESYTRHIDSAYDRFKLRVRAYGPDPEHAPVVFFEVKRKVGSVIVKGRARVPGEAMRPLLSGAWTELPHTSGRERGYLEEFLRLQITHRYQPLVLIRCTREAFAAADPLEDVRLTIDRDLSYQPAQGPDFAHDPHGWIALDTTREHGNSGRNVIVEMKFCQAAPLWMHEVVERLGMFRIAFSKYIAAVNHLRDMGTGGGDFAVAPTIWTS